MKIAILSPPLPPLTDGIADHTALLGQRLAQRHEVLILTHGGTEPLPVSGARIEAALNPAPAPDFSSARELLRRESPDWIFLQYAPLYYGGTRFGNRALPSLLAGLARDLPRARIGLFIHELTPQNIRPRNPLQGIWILHRLKSVARRARILFIPIEAWMRTFPGHARAGAIHVLAVGSNIPRIASSREEARGRMNLGGETLTLGLFGRGAPTRTLEPVRAAARALESAGRKFVILHIGKDAANVESHLRGIPFRAEGILAAEEVSRRMPAIDIYLAPYEDGVSLRRSSLLAAMQHGLAIVGTRGDATSPALAAADGRAFLLSPVGDDAGFADHVVKLASDETFRARLGAEAGKMFEADFSFDRIAERVLAVIEGS
ncbi:glycosyltransferase family 4 protein [Candidatus Sumerlaeota bacterium]|nr:glycosyltransferase family 4 protein [Candidatus Sumerlaeota bacterium]